MKKIAVYGGSFDPPHKGHKLLAENLSRFCGADKVIIVPTAMSPFKNKSGASAEDRLNMCRLLFSESLYEVSDIEILRGGKSYTIDTLTQIKKFYPDSQLYLFMGDDMLLSFSKWYKYEEILGICTLVCACRTENLQMLSEMKDYADKFLGGEENVLICESVPFEISSTIVRDELKNGNSSNVDSVVYEYIVSKGLYK